MKVEHAALGQVGNGHEGQTVAEDAQVLGKGLPLGHVDGEEAKLGRVLAGLGDARVAHGTHVVEEARGGRGVVAVVEDEDGHEAEVGHAAVRLLVKERHVVGGERRDPLDERVRVERGAVRNGEGHDVALVDEKVLCRVDAQRSGDGRARDDGRVELEQVGGGDGAEGRVVVRRCRKEGDDAALVLDKERRVGNRVQLDDGACARVRERKGDNVAHGRRAVEGDDGADGIDEEHAGQLVDVVDERADGGGADGVGRVDARKAEAVGDAPVGGRKEALKGGVARGDEDERGVVGGARAERCELGGGQLGDSRLGRAAAARRSGSRRVAVVGACSRERGRVWA